MPKDIMPYVTITEQPADKSHRFRYLSEHQRRRRSVGSVLGVSSTSEHRTYPAIRVHGYKGPFVVLLSLLNPHNNLVHPNSICMGLESERYKCRDGVLFVISDEPEVVFKNVGILCAKKDDINKVLHIRELINIDPFGAGFSHISDHRLIDFTAVRLCFQVLLPGSDWNPADRSNLSKYTRSLVPVASDVVYDTKKHNDIKIVHVTYCAGPLTGGTEMTLLCDKVEVYLQQSNERGVFRSQPNTVQYHLPTLYPSCQPPPIVSPPQSSGVYQEISPPIVHEEHNFSSFNGHGQYVNHPSSSTQLNLINFQGNNMICNENYVHETDLVSNFKRNNVAFNTQATNANHCMTILNQDTVISFTSGANNAALGLDQFKTIAPRMKIKRSVSEHNNGTLDSREQSAKRDKLSDFKFLDCDESLTTISNNNFRNSTVPLPIRNVDAPISPSEGEKMAVNEPAPGNIHSETLKTDEIISEYLDVCETCEQHVNTSIDDQIVNMSTDFNTLSV